MVRKYKIWGSKRKESEALYVWAQDMDEALFRIARKIDPTVTSTQWTGEEKEGTSYVEMVGKH